MAKIAELEKQIAELERQVATLQQVRNDVQVFSIAYDAAGRILASSSTVDDSVLALKTFKMVLDMILRRTDDLLLAAVEREAKASDTD